MFNLRITLLAAGIFAYSDFRGLADEFLRSKASVVLLERKQAKFDSTSSHHRAELSKDGKWLYSASAVFAADTGTLRMDGMGERRDEEILHYKSVSALKDGEIFFCGFDQNSKPTFVSATADNFTIKIGWDLALIGQIVRRKDERILFASFVPAHQAVVVLLTAIDAHGNRCLVVPTGSPDGASEYFLPTDNWRLRYARMRAGSGGVWTDISESISVYSMMNGSNRQSTTWSNKRENLAITSSIELSDDGMTAAIVRRTGHSQILSLDNHRRGHYSLGENVEIDGSRRPVMPSSGHLVAFLLNSEPRKPGMAQGPARIHVVCPFASEDGISRSWMLTAVDSLIDITFLNRDLLAVLGYRSCAIYSFSSGEPVQLKTFKVAPAIGRSRSSRTSRDGRYFAYRTLSETIFLADATTLEGFHVELPDGVVAEDFSFLDRQPSLLFLKLRDGREALIDCISTLRSHAHVCKPVELIASLGSLDSALALAAMDELRQRPIQAVPTVRTALASEGLSTDALMDMVKGLQSEDYPQRERSSAELRRYGLAAKEVLQDVASLPDQEAAKRAKTLLSTIGGPIEDPATIRGLRAVAVLEGIDDEKSRQLLNELSKGTLATPTSTAAKEALRHTLLPPRQ
jgi:hypothetical protein